MPGIVTIESSAFIARFPVRQSDRQQFVATFEALWRGSLPFLEAQCNLVFYGWDRTDRWFTTIESYKDEQFLMELRQSDMFQETVRTLLGFCDGDMELQLLRGMAAPTDIFSDFPAGPSTVHPRTDHAKVVIS